MDTSDGVRSNDRGGSREAGVLWTPLTKSEATTEAVAEKSNLRPCVQTRFCNKKWHLLRYQFYCKKRSARRGSNPRPPPWQGGAPPLSHSRIAWCVCHTQDIYYYIELCLSTTFFKKHHFFNLTLHLNIFNHLLFNYFPKTIFSCAMSYYSSMLFKFCKNTLCLSLCNINRQCQLFC